MKKYVFIISLVLFSLSALPACSLEPTAGGEFNNDESMPDITLTVLAGQSTSDAGIEDMIDSAIEEKCPEITLEWECVDWGDKFSHQMTAKFAAGEVPDIMIGKAQDVATYTPSGNLAPLSGSYLSYVLEAALPAVTISGKIYGLPYNALYQGVMYNKDIFEKYNINVPKTQAELKEVVEKLKSVNITPYASHFQEIWTIGNMTMQFAMNEVFNKYPDWGDKFRAGFVSFKDSLEFQRCFQYNMDILNATWDNAFAISQAECDRRFANGEAAMYVTGTWSLQIIDEVNSDMNLGIFPFPNENGDPKLIFEPNITFMKSSKSLYGDYIDKVLEVIFSDKDLAVEILNFTKTSSMLKGVSPTFPNPLQPDIDRYVNAGMMTDVTIGNTQLIWTFQEDYSRQLYSWLQGNADIEEVLAYIDENRQNSSSWTD